MAFTSNSKASLSPNISEQLWSPHGKVTIPIGRTRSDAGYRQADLNSA